jgi:hypothetical protein
VSFLQRYNVELQPQVTAGESASAPGKGGLDVIKVYVFTSDLVYGTFLKVYV